MSTVYVHLGHYGSGKTELSLNVALDAAAQGQRVALVDLDIVNPFFRSGEQGELLCQAGVELIAPLFVGTTVDIPALPAKVNAVFSNAYDTVVLDVGGDPAGATALGRYHKELQSAHAWVRCVVNPRRPLSATVADIVTLARDMEQRGRVRIDALINNANLLAETTAQIVADGAQLVAQAAAQLGVAVEFTMTPRRLAQEVSALLGTPVLPIGIHTRPDWMDTSV